MFDIRQGTALLAVIDTGSFELAAQQLHLTPSAVSQRVSALEAELGMPLIVRSKPCRPTHQGQSLVQYLRRSKSLAEEFAAEAQDGPLSVALAVNNDTLATWLLPGLASFLIKEQVLLDVILDDQDHTFALLSQGLALAGVSSTPYPMRGCQVQPLGAMRYHLLASPEFAARWFPKGLQREAARRAPLLVFDRKDKLQADFLEKELGLPPGSYPCHYLPASDPFMQAIKLGLGYGMLPEQQFGSNSGLVDLAPDKPTDVMLYWHSWRVQSPKLERLSAQVLAAAKDYLMPASH